MIQCTNGKITIQEIVDELNKMLPSDGTKEMDAGYAATNPLSLVTKQDMDNADHAATVIHSMAEITQSGTYEGTDVADAAVTGKVIIIAVKDVDYDYAYILFGQDMHIRTGGKPAGGAVMWAPIIPSHLHGTADPLDADGIDGDIYIKLA